YMHNEDSAIGLNVSNQDGKSWRMYGDKYIFDERDKENKDYCIDAVQASVNEIYDAYRTGEAPSPADYEALKIVPTVKDDQELAPLFRLNGKTLERRKDIKNRREREFTTDFTYIGTIRDCELSGLWKYPITMEPKKFSKEAEE
ncbi:15429_t:CDS:1, partial [Acaulospora colombiana]